MQPQRGMKGIRHPYPQWKTNEKRQEKNKTASLIATRQHLKIKMKYKRF